VVYEDHVMKYDFWIVAIGSSAGGLDPLKQMVGRLSKNINAAFIVLTHLLPDGNSNLDNILAKHSRIPAIRAKHGMPIEPNKIYILPENKMMTLQDGLLNLRDRRPDEIINRAIDIFFFSLALDAKEKSIGILLSGGGNDGLLGSKEIGKNHGVIIVQDPQTAEHPYMPNAIIEYNLPDAILSPDEMGDRISVYVGLN